MKSLRMSAINPPYAESTPGTGGTMVRRMRRSRAEQTTGHRAGAAEGEEVNERGSAPWRDNSLDTSRYMPETATPDDAFGRLRQGEAEGLGEGRDGPLGGAAIEGDCAVAEVSAAEEVQDGKGVGEGFGRSPPWP